MEPIGTGLVTVDSVSRYPEAPLVGDHPDIESRAALGEISAPDEDESVSLDLETEGVEVPEDIVYELAIGAATHGREFDGRTFAELLEQGGPIADVRLMIAIAVLRTGQKLNGDRMLRVLEEMGFEGEATAARIARDEIAQLATAGVVEAVSGDGAAVAVVLAPDAAVAAGEGEPS